MIDKIDRYLNESKDSADLLYDYRSKLNDIKLKYEEGQRKLEKTYTKKFRKKFDSMTSKDKQDLIRVKDMFFKERPFEKHMWEYASTLLKTLQGY